MTHTLRYADLDPDDAATFTRNHAFIREQHARTRTRAARVVLEAGLTADDAEYAATYAVARVLHASTDPRSAYARRFPEAVTLREDLRVACAFDPVLERILDELPPDRLRTVRLLIDVAWSSISGTDTRIPTIEASTVAAIFAAAEAGRYEGPGGTW